MVTQDKEAIPKDQLKDIEEGRYYTIKQLADKLHYTRAWITFLVQQGRIKAVKPLGGKTWRIPPAEYHRIVTEGIPPMPKENPTKNAREIEIPEEIADKVAPKRKPSPKDESGSPKDKKQNPYWPLPFNLG